MTLEVDNLQHHQEIIRTTYSQLNTWRWFISPQWNLMLLSRSGLTNNLRRQYNIATIDLDKKYPGELRLTITLTQPVVMVGDGDRFALTDAQGRLVEWTNQKNTEIPFYLNSVNGDTQVNELVVDPQEVEIILEIDQFFNDQLKINAERFERDRHIPTDFFVTIEQGTVVRFNLTQDIQTQLASLDVLIKQELQGNLNGLEYIDLRYQPKIFYRRMNQAESTKENTN